MFEGNYVTPREIEETSLADFIAKNSDEIRQSLDKVMDTTFKGLDNPERYLKEVELLLSLEKKPFPRQARTIVAGFEHLKKNKSLIVSAEMGTGKTLMATAMAFLRIKNSPKDKKLNFGIMCPTTLCKKWREEILEVIGEQNMKDIEVHIVEKGSDLIKWARRKEQPKVTFYIFSKETAKLSYKLDGECRSILKEEVVDGEKSYICPTCGAIHSVADVEAFHKKSLEKAEKQREAYLLGKKTRTACTEYELAEAYGKKWLDHKLIETKYEFFCRKCKIQSNQLQTKDGLELYLKGKLPPKTSRTEYSRISIASAVKSFNTKGFFDTLFVDELHEMKGGDTGQGFAFATLSAHSKKIVGLTGTILNGYVSSLFYILFRMFPRRMIDMGFDYRQESVFVEKFGGYERIETLREGEDVERKVGVNTKKSEGSKVIKKPAPIINPQLIKLLMSDIIFLKQDDMNIPLPDYKEMVIFSEADKNPEYTQYINELLTAIKDRQNPEGKRLLGAFANDALSILDLPFKPTQASYEDRQTGLKVVYHYRPSIKEDYITHKERKLFELLKKEMGEGRKALVYVNFSQLGTAERVEEVLKRLFVEEGLVIPQIKILTSSVEAKKRKEWIKNNPCQILIANPELVKTGLDLYDYPTIVYHQTGYVVQTIKQASRRAWRIGQTQECRVFFLVSKNTPQQVAVSLVAKKIKALNDLEGRIFLTKGELTSVMGETHSIQQAIVNSLSGQGSNSQEAQADDFETWKYKAREYDTFETFFIQKQEEKKSVIVKTQNIEKIQEVEEVLNAEESVEEVVGAEKDLIASDVKDELACRESDVEKHTEEQVVATEKVVAKTTRRGRTRKPKSLVESQPNLFEIFGIEI